MTDDDPGGFRDDVDPIAEFDQKRAEVIEAINRSNLFLLVLREPDGSHVVSVYGTVEDPLEIRRLVNTTLETVPRILDALADQNDSDDSYDR